MSANSDDTDKTHEPTQHKLDEARKKGELARSADLTSAVAYLGVLLAGLAAGAASVQRVSDAMMVLLDRPSELSALFFGGRAAAPVGGLLAAIGLGLLVWFALPAAGALLGVLAQRAFVVAPSKLACKASRINPVANARNKYGPSGLFEFAKSALKLVIYSVSLGIFLSTRLSDMAGSMHAGPQAIATLMARMLVDFMVLVCIIALAIGAIDYLWQRHDHMRRNRMSHQEVRDEHKKHEGDPHMKQERRTRATRIASQQMMSDVPQADVVVVNPTHFAVALKWSRAPGSAPECVAKGVDHMALAIRDLAIEHGVPVRHDPPTARALHATTEVGQQIAPEHYRAVAAAIRFAETLRRRAGSRR